MSFRAVHRATVQVYRKGIIGTTYFPEAKGQAAKERPYRVIVLDVEGTDLLVRGYNDRRGPFGDHWWVWEEIFSAEVRSA